MPAFANPDAFSSVPLNRGELALAQFVEEAALSRIKELLTRMGVLHITREDTMQTMGPKMAAHGISVTHTVGGEEDQDGWWFSRFGKTEIHLKHPMIGDDGRLNLQARFLR